MVEKFYLIQTGLWLAHKKKAKYLKHKKKITIGARSDSRKFEDIFLREEANLENFKKFLRYGHECLKRKRLKRRDVFIRKNIQSQNFSR